MKRIRYAIFLLSMAGLAVRGAMGCASDESLDPTTLADDAGADATTDASASDATTSTDSGLVDATADAAKICTDEGWCHTALPAHPPDDAGVVDPTPLDVRDVWMAADKTAWAVTNEGFVLRWVAGSSWTIVFDAKTPLRSVWGPSTTELWIAGATGYLAHGTNQAGTMVFEKATAGVTDDLIQIGGRSASDVWAVTSKSVFRYQGAKSDAGAPAFVPVTVPNGITQLNPTARFFALWGRDSDLWVSHFESPNCTISPQDICCVYDNACQQHYVLSRFRGGVDGGATWERVSLESTRLVSLKASTTTTDDAIYVIAQAFPGNAAYLGHVTNADAGVIDASVAIDAGAYVWDLEDAPPFGSSPERVWSSSSNDLWLVGSPGSVRHWDGTAWHIAHVSTTSSPLLASLHSVNGFIDSAGKHDLWIVGVGTALHWQEAP